MYQTATQIVNQAAAEVGLTPVSDPYASSDDAFVQLRFLLNSAGQQLVTYHTWQQLVREYVFVTDSNLDPQDYPLPGDFAYMMDQTGWMRDQRVPLMGPLSAQDWQYLKGRNLASSTIYASFRINEGVLKLFPTSSIVGQDQTIAYEYVSQNWVKPATETDPDNYRTEVQQGSDIVLFPTPLPMLYLKGRYLAAKRYDTTRADAEFASQFAQWSGLEKSAPILGMGGRSGGGSARVPFLDGYYNTPDTNYG